MLGAWLGAHVRFWHICDMLSLSQLVRNTPQSGRVKRCYELAVSVPIS